MHRNHTKRPFSLVQYTNATSKVQHNISGYLPLKSQDLNVTYFITTTIDYTFFDGELSTGMPSPENFQTNDF